MATRGSKPSKGAGSRGSGGNKKRGLAGRGPTPRAEDRVYHAAYRKKQASQRRASGRALAKKRKSEHEVVAGRNPVLEALRADVSASRIHLLVGPASDDRIAESLKIAAAKGVPVVEATKSELDDLTEGAAHQGIAMAVAPFEYSDLDDLLDKAEQDAKPPLFVVCDHITDPRNVGAIIRSTVAFGGHGLILPERRSVGVNTATWKTSAGTAAMLPIAAVTNIVRTLEELKSAGVFVVALDGEGTESLPGFVLATEPLAVVVGAEGKGVSRLVKETCDMVCSIPMSAAAESLNASVAASVALYEVATQRAAAVAE